MARSENGGLPRTPDSRRDYLVRAAHARSEARMTGQMRRCGGDARA
jgi:hypothetical protein